LFVFRKSRFSKRMSSTEKKPRLVSMNPILSDNQLIKNFRNAYTNRLSVDEKGLSVTKHKNKIFIFFLKISSSYKIRTSTIFILYHR
jgi:hypothetical protein